MLILGKDIENLEKNSNVLVVGNILNIIEYEKYCDIRVDDNSQVFTVRCFEKDDLKNLKIGDNVLIIGYINEYNEKKRINARKIKTIDEREWLFWKIKSFKINNYKENFELVESEEEEKEEITEEIIQESVIEEEIEEIIDDKKYILDLIKSYNEDLIPIEKIIKDSKLSNEKTEEILKELIEEGEIYEPKIGYIKLLEI